MAVRRLALSTLKTILILFCLWVGGFGLFFCLLPQKVADHHTSTQAIVVLTGGRERLKTGFDLFCSHQANMIFISGVHPGENLKSLLKSRNLSKVTCNVPQDQLSCAVHLGYAAKNTQENAQETADWVNKMSVTSVRLVTAAYHMPRSLMEFKNALPSLTIIPHPVFPHDQDESRGWHNKSLLYITFSEYNKFLWGFVRNRALALRVLI